MRKFPFRFDLPFGNCQTTPSINHRRETCVQVKTQIIFPPTTLANTNIITAWLEAPRRLEWNGWWHTFQNENSRTTGLGFPLDFSAVWKDTHRQVEVGWNFSQTRFSLYLPSKSGPFGWHESSNFGKRCFIIIILLLFASECSSIISCERESFRCANHVSGQRYFELENYATLRLTISTILFCLVSEWLFRVSYDNFVQKLINKITR